jgi:acetylcholinesterase
VGSLLSLPYNFLRRCAHSTGDRRLRLPEPTPPYEGLYYVQAFGKSCPQQRLVLPNGLDSQLVADIGSVVSVLYDGLTPADEDCERAVVLLIIRELSHPPGLTINVVKPSTATSTSNLPVVFVRTFLLAGCHDGLLGYPHRSSGFLVVVSKLVVPLRLSYFVQSVSMLSDYLHSYDGGNIVARSIDLGQPIIFVSVNYR